MFDSSRMWGDSNPNSPYFDETDLWEPEFETKENNPQEVANQKNRY